MAETTITISIHKPWWTGLAFFGAKMLVRLGVRIDEHRFGQWIVGHFRIRTSKD